MLTPLSSHPISEENEEDMEQSLILLVDDQPINHTLLKRVLQREYRIFSVNSGAEALAYLKDNPVDTILLDVNMPLMNGLEVLQQIREDPRTAQIPVIIVSARSADDDVIRGLELGANDYITKPINIDILQARVKTQITLKRLFDEKQQLIDDLNSSQKARERLLGIASHDLKAPLASISMAESFLRESLRTDPDKLEILDIMTVSVENMQEIIDQVLAAETIESGALTISIKETEIATIIMSVVNQFETAAYQKNIFFDIGSVSGVVYADPVRLKQILTNLVSNGIKYSPPASTLRIWSEETDNVIRINIADQGQGIPADERHLLFEPYSKLSTRPTGNESSTGLGLWIVKQLVTSQNAQVGVDCPADGGSVFWVEFPMVAWA